MHTTKTNENEPTEGLEQRRTKTNMHFFLTPNAGGAAQRHPNAGGAHAQPVGVRRPRAAYGAQAAFALRAKWVTLEFFFVRRRLGLHIGLARTQFRLCSLPLLFGGLQGRLHGLTCIKPFL